MEETQQEPKHKLKHIYETKYKQLLLIPLLLFVFAIAQIGLQVATTGDFVNKGVSLTGGISITLNTEAIDLDSLEQALASSFPQSDIIKRQLGTDVVLELGDINAESLVSLLDDQGISKEVYAIEETGSSLGKGFFKAAIGAVIISFLLMGLIVLISFRTFVPSIAVIGAAALDIIVTLAIFNLTGQRLTTAGMAAFLMLIGYSVDTDMLLTTKVLKHSGPLNQSIYTALKTGLTMTVTTLSVVMVALVFSGSEVIRQIMLILLIGLIVDMIATWILNVGILRYYLEKKHES